MYLVTFPFLQKRGAGGTLSYSTPIRIQVGPDGLRAELKPLSGASQDPVRDVTVLWSEVTSVEKARKGTQVVKYSRGAMPQVPGETEWTPGTSFLVVTEENGQHIDSEWAAWKTRDGRSAQTGLLTPS